MECCSAVRSQVLTPVRLHPVVAAIESCPRMDPMIEVAVAGALAVIVAGLITFLGNRSQVAFLERVQADVAAERAERIRLGDRVESLEKINGNLLDELQDRDAHIIVLTQWGMMTEELPPRTPPNWRTRTWEPDGYRSSGIGR
jgi:hypothetical protein